MPIKVLTVLASFVLLVSLTHLISASASPHSTDMPRTVISVAHQKLTVHIDNVPLHEVLQELSEQLSLTVTIVGNIEDRLVSATFADLPIEQGLENLLSGQDYALLHRLPDLFSGIPFKEIVVLPRGDVSSNSTPEKRTVVMSPQRTSQESFGNSTQPDPQNPYHWEPDMRERVLQIEKLVERSDHNPSSSVSLLQWATQDQMIEVRETAIELLEELGQSQN